MIRVVMDTNILIDHLRGVDAAREIITRVKNKELEACISALTEAELLSGKEYEIERKRKDIIELIHFFTKLDIDNAIAQKTGEYRRKYGYSIQDSIIAATAFVSKCKLWTKNVQDFKRIKEIEIEEPY